MAESSLAWDRTKLTRYAWSGIPVAWIVNLSDQTVEVHSAPSGPSGAAGYGDMKVYVDVDEIPVTLDGREAGRFAVREILP